MSSALMRSQSVATQRLGGAVSVVVSGRHAFKAVPLSAQDVQIAGISKGVASRNAIPH